ncbi:hypothetical protein, partial [Novosphingobium sp. 11B]
MSITATPLPAVPVNAVPLLGAMVGAVAGGGVRSGAWTVAASLMLPAASVTLTVIGCPLST